MGKRFPEAQIPVNLKRRRLGGNEDLSLEIKCGSILTDLSGTKWRLGKCIGNGAFGQIYLASDQIDKEVSADSAYVVKVESFESGPLFVEINCYLRIAKPEMINEWKKENNIKNLGMPYYVASGSHVLKNGKYRFLVLPRYKKNLEEFLIENCKFNLKTVLLLSIQILTTLRYIHHKGYIHSDIKASNILLDCQQTKKTKSVPTSYSKTIVRYNGCTPFRTCKVKKETLKRSLRPNSNLKYLEDILDKSNNKTVSSNNQAYLLDYGLATKYLHSNGEHKHFCIDQRRAHAGTLLFCSRDAHLGSQSRRSDLECLGYNMVYWLTGYLPWMEDTEDPKITEKKKQKYLENVKEFLNLCFVNDYPRFLCEYFQYVISLDFEEEPDYDHCISLFHNAIKEYGYKFNMCFDFNNTEGWGCKQKLCRNGVENKRQIVFKVVRSPLRSNLPILRKRLNMKAPKANKRISWSKILLDPETIMKQQNREKRAMDAIETCSTSVINLNIKELNPTPAMMEIYNRSLERISSSNGTSPSYKGDTAFESICGYTPAMVTVYNRKKEREEMETEQLLFLHSKLKVKNPLKPKKRTQNQTSKKQENVLRSTKSQSAVNSVGKKENKKTKAIARRSYSLRG